MVGITSPHSARTVKIRFLASSVGTGPPLQFLSSFVVDDIIAIDAGAIGLLSPVAEHKQIRHVVLSHGHIDHIASLPLFLDNVYDPSTECPTVHAGQHLLESLQRDVFNDRLWPDLTRMADPFVRFSTLVNGQTIQLGGILLTPIAVDHVVPCFAFLIEDDTTAVAIVSDTAPTQHIWEAIGEHHKLQAVFLEASFPNSHQWLADRSKHLTPRDFERELAKMGRAVRVIAVHLKPEFHQPIVRELHALNLASLEIGEPGRVYEF